MRLDAAEEWIPHFGRRHPRAATPPIRPQLISIINLNKTTATKRTTATCVNESARGEEILPGHEQRR